MRQRQLRFGQADEIDRLLRRDRERQRLGIGQADILRRQDDEAPRNEPRVLASRQHLGQPVQRGIGVAPAAAFDEGGDRVVVFVLVGIVANAPLAREGLQFRRSDRRPLRQAEHNHFQCVERPAQIAVAETGKIQQRLVGGRATARSQAALRIRQRTLEHGHDVGGRERIEPEKMAAAEERRVDIESGVVRRGADEAHTAFLHVGQQQILLGLVEPVQLVDE